MMINHRVSGIPIVEEDGQLIGIITEGDLLRRVETGTERRRSRWSEWFSPNSRLAVDYVKSHARRVVTRDVVTVDDFATLGEIADLMEQHRIKRVPVVHDGKLVGIVSRADLLKMLASGTVSVSDEDTDRSIRNRLLTELRQQKWAALLNETDVVVSDGVVHLWGVVGSEQLKALRIIAENTPGVQDVADHTILGPLRPGPGFQ